MIIVFNRKRIFTTFDSVKLKAVTNELDKHAFKYKIIRRSVPYSVQFEYRVYVSKNDFDLINQLRILSR